MKWAGLLGLARRAGKVASGMEAVVQAVRRGRARLVFLAADAGPHSERKVREACRAGRVPVVAVADKAMLGRLSGSRPVVAVAVIDDNLARAIRGALAEADGPDAGAGEPRRPGTTRE